MPPMPVEVVAARSDTVVDAILATGQIEAMQSVELRPDIEGRIAEILVREGATVARGAPLFKVDDAELRAEVAQAEAERDLARQSLARTRELLGRRPPASRSSSTPRPPRAVPKLSSRCSRSGSTAPSCGHLSPESRASAM
jgi:membrane fusion protein (multidrug efflux system)